ncbi:hypothetical protein LAZ67_7003027 [Cordylochernes scorpioides]|uniref:GPR180/TMEM145 transmembrane domain-containing protein n=1 Tax=Cordylochernes scorpioides TaxID=51811 RepID=A0ABY6KP54_9ARAC|nr:hypothetical protein LAZ67_7003027 [Cordylochernes scorpioides]
MLKIYATFFGMYAVLFPVQCYAAVVQGHRLTRIFTGSLLLRLLYLVCFFMHFLVYSVDGLGMSALRLLGDFLYILSESLLLLLLLLLAKGWAISKVELGWVPSLILLWLLYTCLQVMLYLWNTMEVDVIEDLDEYQTIPGWLALGLRMVIMGWFVLELRETMRDSANDLCRQKFYLHFGAGILVWFVYLPVAALIALAVSSLSRPRFLLGMTSTADVLAYSILIHLFWPTRTGQYLQLATMLDPSEELEEFSEAPHNVQHPNYKRKV